MHKESLIASADWTIRLVMIVSKVRLTRPGLDMFRRQPDGSWKIARHIAYEAL